MQIHRGAWTSS
ncbi:unnamed protein product [Linum tenue]|uniref:Uncharacterized protein n=1 Tax=Linum tenue TaxID=586396 RepID=A0AAV0LHV5_9ROSI|nr:unnamed protein product [Linum tenue]